jgi:RimJ/RimL family protein N-acetyltransferase
MRFPTDVPELADGTVTLRAARPDDAAVVVEQCLDPVSVAWTTVPLEYTHRDAMEFLTVTIPQGWREETSFTFVVDAEHQGTSRFVGTVSLRMAGDHRAEVAFGAHPAARGRGQVARAVRLLLSWGFEELDLTTVVWWSNRGNWPSRRLAWSLGFAVEGAVRAWLPQRGELQDAWVGTLCRGDQMHPCRPWHLSTPLSDGRLALRESRPEDDPRIVEACNDPVTAAWLGGLPVPYHETDARWWREHVREGAAIGDRVSWVFADPATDQLLGVVDLFAIRQGWDAEIGFWTHPEARGRGLTTAACGLVLAHAFRPAEQGGLGLVRVQGVAAVGNDASARVLERIGMRRAGVYRAYVNMRTGRTDAVLFDALGGD